MIYNYITIAIRNLQKNPIFTAINLLGLSLGMTAFILIFQYISFEKSVNGFHANLPNLYRVLMESKEGGVSDGIAAGLPPLSIQQLQNIKDYCRIAPGSSLGDGVVSLEDSTQNAKSFRERNFAYVDGSFFQLFTFRILEGSDQSIIQPNTVALSESSSRRYFGDETSIGKVITLNNQFGKTLYTVSMVYADMPDNSDFQYDMVFSLETLANKANLNGNEMWASLDGMNSRWMKSYLLLQPTADFVTVERGLQEIKSKVNPEDTDVIRLQPFSYQHLAPTLSDNFPTTGNLGFIYLLTGISILILVIAWLNYINLSTAGSLIRAKEVGIRKVSGASKIQLVWQFLGESIFMNLLALLAAVAFVNVIQSSYNYFLGKELSLNVLQENNFWLLVVSLLIIGSMASGAYTAFALASFKPTHTLKGIFSKSERGIWLRKMLVVFQFTISIMLIACTLILQRQLHFLQNKNLGMEVSQLLVINGAEVGKDETFKDRSAGFENELAQLGFIDSYCRTSAVPIDGYNYGTPGITKQNPLPGDENLIYNILYTDYRYLEVYSITLAAGSGFTEEMGRQSWVNVDKVLVNEKAALQLGFVSSLEAVGQKIVMENKEYELIGIIKDYHHMSLRETIDPIIFFPRNNGGFYTIKITTQNIASNITILEKVFKKYFPGNPFEYYFQNDKYNQQYQTEQQYGTLFSIASGLAIFIACLGLLGLAAFSVEQRIKEIGIRKVLGASVVQITTLISKDFLLLVFIALVIATPFAWYAMNLWLQEFAYHTEISWWIFAIAGTVSILIALITVSSQAIKAGFSNPVESLRSE